MNELQVCGDSIVGRDHTGSGNVLVGRNNQDAFRIRQDENMIVAVACDGCGSQPFSEVGARLGADFISKTLFDFLLPIGNDFNTPIRLPVVLELARIKMLAVISSLARDLSVGKIIKIIDEYFLFTVIGAIIDGNGCSVFSLGDGYYAINGDVHALGPFVDNEPPYLAYGLTGTKSNPAGSKAWKFIVQSYCSLHDFSSVMIGTDGVKHLIAAADKNIPGKEEKVGSIEQFWTVDKYFENPEALHLRLALINRNFAAVRKGELKREPGLLPDDTTLAVIRQKPIAEGTTDVCLS